MKIGRVYGYRKILEYLRRISTHTYKLVRCIGENPSETSIAGKQKIRASQQDMKKKDKDISEEHLLTTN